jgi:hypothetical protein
MALLSTALGNTHPSVSNTLDLRPCEAWLLGHVNRRGVPTPIGKLSY